ncbi:hypothetical protein ES705_18309 [subsurface metagenome]
MQGESPGRARSFGRLLEGENPLFISLDNDYIPSLSTSGGEGRSELSPSKFI